MIPGSQGFFRIKFGDTRPRLIALCSDANGAAVDLTGLSSALLLARDVADGTELQRTMTVVSPATAGKVQYVFLAADWTTVGDKFSAGSMYDFEVQLTWGDGGIQTLPTEGNLNIYVEPDQGP